MNKIWLILGIALPMVAMEEPPGEFKGNGYSLKLPVGYHVDSAYRRPQGAIISHTDFFKNGMGGVLAIQHVRDNSPGAFLKPSWEVAQHYKSDFTKKGMEIVEEGSVLVDSKEAYQMVVTDKGFKVLNVFFNGKEKKSYTIYLLSQDFERDRCLIEQMLASWKFE